MSRWRLPMGVGLAIGVVALAGVLALGAANERTAAERGDALAAELRCPDCQGLSVADSPTRSAQEIRHQIDELIAGGASDDEVRAHFTARYGEWIRLAPSAPAPWVLPFTVVVGAVLGLVAWLRRARRAGHAATTTARLSAEDRRRLHDEAEALDA